MVINGTILRITFRRLFREKLHSFLNIFGLAIGVASVLLIALFIQDELSYDRFHTNLDRIYRVTTGMRGDGQPTNANGQIATGPTLARVYPQIETFVRFRKFGWNESRVVAYNDRRFYEKRFVLADSTVFRVFSFKLIQGNPATALDAPRSVVLTESSARKYFGTESPLGKSISVDMNNDGNFVRFAVTGIVEDLPEQSSIQFDFLGSLSSQTDTFFPWSLESIFTFVLLHEGTDVLEITSTLPGFISRQRGRETSASIHLQPLRDVRLFSPYHGQMEPPGDISTIIIFGSVGLFILLIACINFVNLATARSMRRAREVGMRKVLGAHRRQLLRHFVGESAVVTVLSVVLGVILTEFMLPGFNALAEKHLSLAVLASAGGAGFLLALTLLIALAASAYPASILASFSPLTVMRYGGARGKGGGAAVRKTLVILQFTLSAVLLISTAVAYQQLRLIRTMNLGFDRDQILVLPLNDEIRNKQETVRNELTRDPRVLSVSLSEQVPGRAGNGSGFIMEGMEERTGAHRLFVDRDYLKTYRIELLAGRDFSTSQFRDADEAFLVNESLLKSEGVTDPVDALGRSFSMFYGGAEKKGRIIGVVKDFHIQSLHDNIEELFLTMMPVSNMNFVSIRIAPGHLGATLSHIRSVWENDAPAYPFDYYFVDDDFDRIHRADERTGEVFAVFAVLALVAACLGLFGLASYAAAQRTKEVGIRKVLGASVPGVVSLLAREFTVMVGTAILFSWPIAYLGMSRWLESFAYRTEIAWWLFPAAGSFVLLIALLTVGIQGIRAATANPVDALRYE